MRGSIQKARGMHGEGMRAAKGGVVSGRWCKNEGKGLGTRL